MTKNPVRGNVCTGVDTGAAAPETDLALRPRRARCPGAFTGYLAARGALFGAFCPMCRIDGHLSQSYLSYTESKKSVCKFYGDRSDDQERSRARPMPLGAGLLVLVQERAVAGAA